MQRLIRALFPFWQRPSEKPRKVHGPQPSRRVPVAANGGIETPDTAPPPDPSAADAIGARRPLIAKDGSVVGFEFRISPKLQEHVCVRAPAAIQASYAVALLAAARRVAQPGRIGLARIPVGWLSALGDTPVAAGVWIALEAPAGDGHAPAVAASLQHILASWQRQGAKLGWPVGLEVPATPDFVLMQPGLHSIAHALGARKDWQAAYRALPVVATDLRNVHEAEYALAHQVHCVCGSMLGQLHADAGQDMQVLPPAARRLSEIIALLNADAATAQVADRIKGDVGLSLRVLQRANAAVYARSQNSSSVEEAVAVLGRRELHRWMSVFLLQYAQSSRVQSALHVLTLWRSRHLELLAAQRSDPHPQALFMLGLASMLVPLLKTSAQQVCEMLSLSAPARQALLDAEGPYAPYLELVQRHEANTLDEVPALLALFGGVHQVKALSEQAWAWAEANYRDA